MTDYRVHIRRKVGLRQSLGTLSIFRDTHHVYSCQSLELAWKDNKRNISCIPASTYEVMKVAPTKRVPYPSFLVMDVPERSGIKIHAGNFSTQIEGCILVGTGFIDMNADGLKDVFDSRITLDLLYRIMPDKFLLEIIEV